MVVLQPLLVENIEEELDPVLDPVLERRLVKKGKSWVLQLADKEVDFTDTFKLFCTTRLPNPHFTPELCAKVTVVDFTVTMAGEVHATQWTMLYSAVRKHPCLGRVLALLDTLYALFDAGLEDQLLGKLILKEKHELEEQRQQLLEEVQSYKKKIKQLEDDLLFRCVSGNVCCRIVPLPCVGFVK